MATRPKDLPTQSASAADVASLDVIPIDDASANVTIGAQAGHLVTAALRDSALVADLDAGGNNLGGVTNVVGLSGVTLALEGQATTGSPAVKAFNGNALTAAAGDQVLAEVSGEVNQTGTAGYVGLLVQMTETGIGSGEQVGLLVIQGGVSTLKADAVEARAVRLTTTEAGSASDPVVEASQGSGCGLSCPSPHQLHLGANGESVIVDNDDATPALRPDVTATWDLGEAAAEWRNGYFSGDLAVGGTVTAAPKAIRTEAAGFSVDDADHDTIIRSTATSAVAATFNTGTAGEFGSIVLTGVAGELTLTSGTATVQVEEGYTTTSLSPSSGKGVTLSYFYLTASLVHVVGGLIAA